MKGRVLAMYAERVGGRWIGIEARQSSWAVTDSAEFAGYPSEHAVTLPWWGPRKASAEQLGSIR